MKITLLYNNVLISVGPDVLTQVKVWVIRAYMLAQSVLSFQKFSFVLGYTFLRFFFSFGVDGTSLGNQFVAFQKALFSFERLGTDHPLIQYHVPQELSLTIRS